MKRELGFLTNSLFSWNFHFWPACSSASLVLHSPTACDMAENKEKKETFSTFQVLSKLLFSNLHTFLFFPFYCSITYNFPEFIFCLVSSIQSLFQFVYFCNLKLFFIALIVDLVLICNYPELWCSIFLLPSCCLQSFYTCILLFFKYCNDSLTFIFSWRFPYLAEKWQGKNISPVHLFSCGVRKGWAKCRDK